MKTRYLIRKRAMGDVLWTEPVIRQLAARHKQLVVYTKFPQLFENFPLSNVSFTNTLSTGTKLLLKAERLLGLSFLSTDLDNSYERQPDIHFLHAYQDAAGLPRTTEYPKLYLSEKEKNERLIDGRYVILHLESFTGQAFRNISGVAWEEVARTFAAAGYKIVQIGVNPLPLKNAVQVKTSLRELMSLCHHASCFVGIDSGPSHIAASLGVRALIFFGAINPLNRHFPELFNGLLAKQPCEYDDCQRQVLEGKPLPCHRSADPAVALCSHYSTEAVVLKIQQLIASHDQQVPA